MLLKKGDQVHYYFNAVVPVDTNIWTVMSEPHNQFAKVIIVNNVSGHQVFVPYQDVRFLRHAEEE